MFRLPFAALAAALTLLGIGPLPAPAAAAPAGCWGQLKVSPGQAAVGSSLLLQGQHYACSGPAGFLPRATVMFYQPNYGFAMFVVHPARAGSYQQWITVPQRLRAIADIRSGGSRTVPTRAGRYYFSISLFDVSVAPISKALASLTLVPGTVPSLAQMAALMARTVEARNRATHFAPSGLTVTTRDGRGLGALTAAVGMRSPAADSAGQLTFFWFNRQLVGWDSQFESARILKVSSPASGTFRITYAHYATHDPMCCPTLRPITVQSGWSGTMLISNGIPPPLPGKVKVILLPGK